MYGATLSQLWRLAPRLTSEKIPSALHLGSTFDAITISSSKFLQALSLLLLIWLF